MPPGDYETMFVRDHSTELIRTPHWERKTYTKKQKERMLDTYDGAIRYTDDSLGVFFNRLKKLGVYDKSTIMVTSDHGEAFGEHGVYLHSHHFYEELVRVPLIIRAPGMSKRGGYNHYLYQTIDIAPTVGAAFGLAKPKMWSGVDVFAQLANPKLVDAERTVVSMFNNFGIHRRMLRSYQSKVVYQSPADKEVFLATVGKPYLLPSVSFDKEIIHFFDMQADPFEKTNLYSSKALKESRWASLLGAIKSKRFVAAGSKEEISGLDSETESDLRSMGYIQ